MGVVFSAVGQLVPLLTGLIGFLEALDRDAVAVVEHLEVVLELDEAVDVETPVGIEFQTLSNY